jgi:hypothetical protein
MLACKMWKNEDISEGESFLIMRVRVMRPFLPSDLLNCQADSAAKASKIS